MFVINCLGKERLQVSTVGNSTNIFWHKCSVERSDREELLQQKGCVVWITGLSGSGLFLDLEFELVIIFCFVFISIYMSYLSPKSQNSLAIWTLLWIWFQSYHVSNTTYLPLHSLSWLSSLNTLPSWQRAWGQCLWLKRLGVWILQGAILVR